MESTVYTKISDSVSNHFILDNYFYYLLVKCNGEIYNLRGAILDERWEVAYVSTRNLLFHAAQTFTYIHGFKVHNENDRYLVFLRLKEKLDDKNLLSEIMQIENLQLFDENSIKIHSKRILEIVYDELNLRKYLELSVVNNYVDFPVLLETYVKIDEMEELIDAHKARYKFSREMNEQFLKLSEAVKPMNSNYSMGNELCK